MVLNAEVRRVSQTSAPKSERRSSRKNSLTGPTLLEMSGNRSVYQASGLRCRGLHGHAAIGQVALMKQSQKLRLVIRVFRSSFAQKSFSIFLDTHTLREQDHVEVSPFEARLPLRSPKAVSLKVKLHIERKEGTTCPLFIPSSAALPPVRRTGPQTQDASGSKGNTTHALLARCEWEF